LLFIVFSFSSVAMKALKKFPLPESPAPEDTWTSGVILMLPFAIS
jgi:hypothetical protein